MGHSGVGAAYNGLLAYDGEMHGARIDGAKWRMTERPTADGGEGQNEEAE